MKKIGFVIPLLLIAFISHAQDQACPCPPMKMYIYDTKMLFPLDSTVEGLDKGKYVEAQASGDWLDGDYEKQKSDEFQVYKGIAPGASTGSTYQPPPDDGLGSSGVDFSSFVTLSREGMPGKYTYNVNLIIVDLKKVETITNITQIATDLGEVDSMIDALVGSLGSVPDFLRNHQKRVRDQSNGSEWIGVKWKATADKMELKINQTTTLKIKVFDCVDGKPVTDKDINVKVTNTDVGSLSEDHVKTNSSGEGEVLFTAKNNGSTKVYADFTYQDINDQDHNATSCTDQKDITVADAQYKVKMEAELTGPAGMHYKLTGESNATLVPYADSTYGLRPVDGTKNMQIKVEAAGIPGKMSLVNPLNYNIPFVINIGNVGKKFDHTAKAKISIEAFSPTADNGQRLEETYSTNGYNLVIINNINQLFNAAFMQNTMASAKDNATKGRQDLVFLQRLKANKNNPAYFQTAQGKADMLALQKLSQENGFDLSNMYSGAGKAPAGASSASHAFVQGIKNTQKNPAGAPNAYSPTVIGGSYQKDGTFSPQSSTAMEIDDEAGQSQMHGTIKITIEKVK